MVRSQFVSWMCFYDLYCILNAAMTLFVHIYLFICINIARSFSFLIFIFSFIGVYRLGYNAVEYGDQNCGHVLTTYPNALRASTALCVLCFILVLALGVTTSVVLCCASKSPLIQPRPSIKADFIPPSQESEADEIGVVGNSVRIDG